MPGLPRLIVITDWTQGRERVLRAVESALAVSPEVAVQHRDPEATGRVFLDEARALREVVARYPGRRLFVNGRLDVALLVEADLHLPASAPPVAQVRPFLPQGRLVSAAVHSEEEAKAAAGVDLALVSPVFEPGSKPGDTRPQLGPEGFERIRSALACPAFALGGVDPENAGLLRGAAGAAVISAVMRARDPAGATAALLAALCSRPG